MDVVYVKVLNAIIFIHLHMNLIVMIILIFANLYVKVIVNLLLVKKKGNVYLWNVLMEMINARLYILFHVLIVYYLVKEMIAVLMEFVLLILSLNLILIVKEMTVLSLNLNLIVKETIVLSLNLNLIVKEITVQIQIVKGMTVLNLIQIVKEMIAQSHLVHKKRKK